MEVQKISLIAAMAENRAIGIRNGLPWSLPADHENFFRVTKGKPYILGRKSYESPEALLSEYRNIVLTRRKLSDLPPNTETAASVAEAMEKVKEYPEVMILGGSTVYEQFLPVANYLYLTIVKAEVEADAYFPELDWSQWECVEAIPHEPDDRHAYAFSINEYRRIKGKV